MKYFLNDFVVRTAMKIILKKEHIEKMKNVLFLLQEDELKQNSIIFIDKDSHGANSKLRFLIQNDTRSLLKLSCANYELDKQGSVYNCKVKFGVNYGSLPTNPYCVIVKAVDETVLNQANRSVRKLLKIVFGIN